MTFDAAQRQALEERVVTFSQRIREVEEERRTMAAGFNGEKREIRRRLDAILDALKANDEEILATAFGEHWEQELLAAPVSRRRGA